MKMKLVAGTLLSMMMTAPFAQEVSSLNNDTDKISYSIGVDLGSTIQSKGISINVPAMAQGINDGISGDSTKLLLKPEEMKEVLAMFQKNMMAKATAQFESLAKDNQTKGSEFLKANKDKPGVVTLPSGLQYKIVTEGKGPKPKATDTVTVEYKGTLINGTEFDSTDASGKPATFALNQVIRGWTEGLQLMPVGSTWEFYVPSQLAYGSRSVGNVIGPNETLIFTVKLISIAKTDTKDAKEKDKK